MKDVLDWINTNPVGVAIKVGFAGSLGYLLADVVPGLEPVIGVLVSPILVALIDYLNPENDRFGVTRG